MIALMLHHSGMKSAGLLLDSLARGSQCPIDDPRVAGNPAGEPRDREAGLPALHCFLPKGLDFRVDQDPGGDPLVALPGNTSAPRLGTSDPPAGLDPRLG